MRYEELLKAARSLGAQHGGESSAWYWDRTNPTKADLQKVLKGIKDGDPEIMDSFPGGPLSGEDADGMTPNKLYEEIAVSELQLRNWEETHHLDDLCTEYEQGFSSAYEDSIAAQCREQLEEEFTLTINVKVTEITNDTMRAWASDVEEAAARNPNVSIDDCNVTDVNDERVY